MFRPLLKVAEFISSLSAWFFLLSRGGCCTRNWIAALPNYSHYVHGKLSVENLFLFPRKEKKKNKTKKTPVCVCILCRSPLFFFISWTTRTKRFKLLLGLSHRRVVFFFFFSFLNKRNPRGSSHNTPSKRFRAAFFYRQDPEQSTSRSILPNDDVIWTQQQSKYLHRK